MVRCCTAASFHSFFTTGFSHLFPREFIIVLRVFLTNDLPPLPPSLSLDLRHAAYSRQHKYSRNDPLHPLRPTGQSFKNRFRADGRQTLVPPPSDLYPAVAFFFFFCIAAAAALPSFPASPPANSSYLAPRDEHDAPRGSPGPRQERLRGVHRTCMGNPERCDGHKVAHLRVPRCCVAKRRLRQRRRRPWEGGFRRRNEPTRMNTRSRPIP